MDAFSMFSILLMLGGGSDLLDYVPSKVYWEIYAVPYKADAMLGQLGETPPAPSGRAGARSVHRLMAIRTLGEMKHRPAREVLETLTKSREMFVADYAREAFAAVEGKKYERPTVAKADRGKDIWLMPRNVAVVGQSTLRYSANRVKLKPLVGTWGHGIDVTRGKAIDGFFKRGPVVIAEKVGNLRLQSVTLAISDDNAGRKGYVAVIGRGQYDAERMKAALRQICTKRPARIKKIGEMEVFYPDRGIALIFPSNHRAVLLTALEEEFLPIEAMAEALRSGRGGLTENKGMADAIRAAATAAPVWAVSKLSDAYRKSPALAAFDSAALVGRQTEGGVTVSVIATVKDARKLEASMKIIEDNATWLRRLKEKPPTGPFKPPNDPTRGFFNSMVTRRDGNQVSATTRHASDSTYALTIMPWGIARRVWSDAKDARSPKAMEGMLGPDEMEEPAKAPESAPRP